MSHLGFRLVMDQDAWVARRERQGTALAARRSDD